MYFMNGKLYDNGKTIAYIQPHSNQILIGDLKEGKKLVHYLKVQVEEIAEWMGLKILNLGKQSRGNYSSNSTIKNNEQENFVLPIKIICDRNNGRIYVQSTKVLYYTRIAKTGSKSFIQLINQTQKENNFTINLSYQDQSLTSLTNENHQQRFWKVQSATDKIIKNNFPVIYIRHYNFISFQKHLHKFTPDFISVVR